MIDPLTALSLLCNVAQLIDFGIKFVNTVSETITNGSSSEHIHCKTTVAHVTRICNDLLTQQLADSKGNEAQRDPELLALVSQANAAASSLRIMIERLSGTSSVDGISRKRKRDAVVATFQSLWKEKDVKRLRTQLLELQQAMVLNLMSTQRQSTGQILHRLEVIGFGMEQERRQKATELEELLSKLKLDGRDPSVSVDSRSLYICFQEYVKRLDTATVCRTVLASLAFSELHSRQDMIVEAHARTFQWIFDGDDLSFHRWATSKNGVFWITGKPGSGKSTLMKFLAEHSRTRELLEEWAGGEKLIIAHHYFWNSGYSTQKSKIGLIRTLLYHIVQQFPDEAIKIMPNRFHNRSGAGLSPWTQTELCESLEKFGKHRGHGARLCFFIDGLDEYEGDHLDLVEYLAKLANCQMIKLCVSSRPWNTFARAYNQQADGRLSVQDFTRDDIRSYIAHQMNGSELFRNLQRLHPEGSLELVRALSDKAQGVFLWVHLVVRSLLRGLNNDDDLDILERRLHEHPSTLAHFYKRMLDRVEPVYQLHGARILSAAVAAGDPLPQCAPQLLELEMINEKYAIRMPIGAKHQLCTQNPEQLRRYLDARCGDLLEVSGRGINFVHRTARDFLDGIQIKDRLVDTAGLGFDPVFSLGNIFLTRIKDFTTDEEEFGYLIQHLLELAKRVSYARLSDMLSIVDHLNDVGEQIFTSSDGPAPDSIEKSVIYKDSRWSFKIQAALYNLRAQVPQNKSVKPPMGYELSQADLDDSERELLEVLSRSR